MIWRFVGMSLLVCTTAMAEDRIPAARLLTSQGQKKPTAEALKVLEERMGSSIDGRAVAERLVSWSWDKTPFWTSLEQLAEASDSHIVTTSGRIMLKPGKQISHSQIRGPFRFVVREVTSRFDLQSNVPVYEVSVEIAWEPWVNVFRLDTSPTVTKATTDSGRTITVAANNARTIASGTSSLLTVRPQGLKRQDQSFNMEGTVTLTLAESMLTFEYDSTGKSTGMATQDGVSARIVKSAAEVEDWIVDVALQYPKDSPKWESFEASYWNRGNVLRLRPPTGAPVLPDTVIDDGTIRHVFKGRGKLIQRTWKIDYRTPGPMREVTIPFELKNIPLP